MCACTLQPPIDLALAVISFPLYNPSRSMHTGSPEQYSHCHWLRSQETHKVLWATNTRKHACHLSVPALQDHCYCWHSAASELFQHCLLIQTMAGPN